MSNLSIQYDELSYLQLKATSDICCWGSAYKLKLKNFDDTEISTFDIEDTRYVAYLGKAGETIVIVRLDYIDDQSSVAIDFFEYDNIKKVITKTHTHIIPSDFTIGDTQINVSKINNNKFIILWSDLCNYNYLQMCTFSKQNYSEFTLNAEIFEEIDFFDRTWIMSEDCFVCSRVIGHRENLTTIIITSVTDETFGAIAENLTIFDHNRDNNEFESSILDCISHDLEQYYLLRVVVETRVNTLKLDRTIHYILVKANFNKLMLVEVVKQLKREFSPTIAIINNKPKIFCSQYLEDHH
jgi:hypothetical protein